MFEKNTPKWLRWGVEVKLVEAVTRLCCDPKKDLARTAGWWGDTRPQPAPSLYFCKHCGRHWREEYVDNPDWPHWSGAPRMQQWVPLLFDGERDRPREIADEIGRNA